MEWERQGAGAGRREGGKVSEKRKCVRVCVRRVKLEIDR